MRSGYCLIGDAATQLRRLPAGAAQTCVTSPPYWGLRDYGDAGQLGGEATPALYVARLVAVFREVRRALRDDGTLWLNLGDCYVTNPGNGRGGEGAGLDRGGAAPHRSGCDRTKCGLAQKNLVGIPWRVALALQEDGWYLRGEVIWVKPNPMPEGDVTDRPTRAHEHVFLLAKAERYYLDGAAVREPTTQPRGVAALTGQHKVLAEGTMRNGRGKSTAPDRNFRSVWTIAPVPFRGAHFAVFPPALVERCVLAGAPPDATVIDPFMGSGTVAGVAEYLGRRWLGTELNRAYAALHARRIRDVAAWFDRRKSVAAIDREAVLRRAAALPASRVCDRGGEPHDADCLATLLSTFADDAAA